MRKGMKSMVRRYDFFKKILIFSKTLEDSVHHIHVKFLNLHAL